MLLLFIAIYLLGSIPTGLIVAKLYYDCDPRNHGSGNIGMTNVWRVLGANAGLMTLLGDLGKGTLAIFIAQQFSTETFAIGIAAIVVVIGHCYSGYLRFTGGKGVATAGGALLALKPVLFFTIFAIWLLVKLLTKKSSFSALISAVLLLPLSSVLLPQQLYTFTVMVLIITIRHKDNISRLRQGTE